MPVQIDPEGFETRHLHEFLNLAGARVVEIGSGMGRLLWRYADAVARVSGIDPDLTRLETAARNCPPPLRARVNFLQGRAEMMPFRQEMFDSAVLGWSL